ncbi:MAG: FAD:protein FMN transferase [Candidatus Eremiobacteraeota bacterium]|nr:FAD:protein FMN transferase [Candidatus Eremiobacteraeota bacterium]
MDSHNCNKKKFNMNCPMKPSKWRLVLSALLGFILVIGFYSIYRSRQVTLHEYKTMQFHMDTYIKIIVVSGDREEAEMAMQKAFRVFVDLDSKFSVFDPDSMLSRLNNGGSSQINDKGLLEIVEKSKNYAVLTKGAFDPTIGAVKLLYPIGRENPVPPGNDEIERALENSGYEKIKLSGNKLEKPADMIIDFGGILKGHAVDRAMEVLRKSGIESALVDAGGNIRVIGKNAEGKAWRIGVQHPRSPDKIMTVISLNNRAVATSGDYQRCFFYKGVRYHHVINPHTGKPARRAIGVTVIAPDAQTADAISTAVFVMGKKKGIKFLHKEKLDGIVIDDEGPAITSGLKDHVVLDY